MQAGKKWFLSVPFGGLSAVELVLKGERVVWGGGERAPPLCPEVELQLPILKVGGCYV